MKKVWMRCVESDSHKYKVGRYYRIIPSIATYETFTDVCINDVDRSKDNLPKVSFVRVYWKEEIKTFWKDFKFKVSNAVYNLRYNSRKCWMKCTSCTDDTYIIGKWYLKQYCKYGLVERIGSFYDDSENEFCAKFERIKWREEIKNIIKKVFKC